MSGDLQRHADVETDSTEGRMIERTPPMSGGTPYADTLLKSERSWAMGRRR